MSDIKMTLGDPIWLFKNESTIRDIFPQIWTHTANINWLGVRFKLKVAGVNYTDDSQVSQILLFLTRIKLLEIDRLGDDCFLIRTNPNKLAECWPIIYKKPF